MTADKPTKPRKPATPKPVAAVPAASAETPVAKAKKPARPKTARATKVVVEQATLPGLQDTAPAPARAPALVTAPAPAPAPARAPAPAPAPEAPSSADSADPGFRYFRRPPAEPVAARTAPTSSVPSWRQRPQEREPSAPPPPRNLDMAELAARRRETQAVTRREVAPLPPRREPLDLQQRAARYAKPVEDGATKPEPTALDRPAAAPMAPSVPALATTSPASDVDMMARAADQTRHKRAAGPAQGETIAQWTTRTDAAPQGSLVFALVTRNHGPVAADRLQQWKRVLDRPDARFVQLDLGSTDDSVAVLSDQPGLQLLVLPGGLVTPAETLLALGRHLPGDVLLVADASAEPDSVAVALVTAVRSGALAAVAPRRNPTVLAISSAKLEANADKLLRSWAEFAAVGTGVVRFGAEQGPASGRGLVAALEHLPLRERLWSEAKTALHRLRLHLPL